MQGLKEGIHDLFQQTREAPSGLFEEENFLQGLVRPGSKAVDDSFKGKRLKNRFLDRVQSEFSVCFPDEVFDKRWHFADFVAYVEKRRAAPAVNLRMAKKRLDRSWAADIPLLILVNVLLIPPAFLLAPPLVYFYLFLPLAANAAVIGFTLKEIRYYKRLIRKLEG